MGSVKGRSKPVGHLRKAKPANPKVVLVGKFFALLRDVASEPRGLVPLLLLRTTDREEMRAALAKAARLRYGQAYCYGETGVQPDQAVEDLLTRCDRAESLWPLLERATPGQASDLLLALLFSNEQRLVRAAASAPVEERDRRPKLVRAEIRRLENAASCLESPLDPTEIGVDITDPETAKRLRGIARPLKRLLKRWTAGRVGSKHRGRPEEPSAVFCEGFEKAFPEMEPVERLETSLRIWLEFSGERVRLAQAKETLRARRRRAQRGNSHLD